MGERLVGSKEGERTESRTNFRHSRRLTVLKKPEQHLLLFVLTLSSAATIEVTPVPPLGGSHGDDGDKLECSLTLACARCVDRSPGRTGAMGDRRLTVAARYDMYCDLHRVYISVPRHIEYTSVYPATSSIHQCTPPHRVYISVPRHIEYTSVYPATSSIHQCTPPHRVYISVPRHIEYTSVYPATSSIHQCTPPHRVYISVPRHIEYTSVYPATSSIHQCTPPHLVYISVPSHV
ncbi:hypothetical protein Btru_001875 [Bulinus truncatus]|nr:hypothetical protein Btru_001875 [Bulinus truncatus]